MGPQLLTLHALKNAVIQVLYGHVFTGPVWACLYWATTVSVYAAFTVTVQVSLYRPHICVELALTALTCP